MQRTLALGYALLAYLAFFAVFLWLVAFVADAPFAPTSVNRAVDGTPLAWAIMVDIGLIALFGIQHSVMARPGFKKVWTQTVPPSVERSTYVLFASLILALLLAYWHSIPTTIWDVRGTPLEYVAWALFAVGWTVLFISTWLINHFDLFGLRQAWWHGRGDPPAPELRTPLFYKAIAHPIYTGFTIAFWATPHMTVGHLVLAIGMQAYIAIGIQHEERDLTTVFGDDYRRYRKSVGTLFPWLGRREPRT